MKVTTQIIVEKGEDYIELSYEEGKKLYEELNKLYEKDKPFELPDPLPWSPTVTYRLKTDNLNKSKKLRR